MIFQYKLMLPNFVFFPFSVEVNTTNLGRLQNRTKKMLSIMSTPIKTIGTLCENQSNCKLNLFLSTQLYTCAVKDEATFIGNIGNL